VRLLLGGVMLASLVMSATLPEAFDERGLGFASAYVMIQVGRTVVVLLLLGRDHQLTPNFRRVLAWLVLTGVLWAGGLPTTGRGPGLWVVALPLDYA
jgi:low temperature requirement protein LtrA